MNKDRPKQILDSTFAHLEKVLEEMRREKNQQRKIVETSRRKSTDREKNDPTVFKEPY